MKVLLIRMSSKIKTINMSDSKRQFYNSCVLPAMIYRAEIWALTNQAKNRLVAAQTKLERHMLTSHTGTEK